MTDHGPPDLRGQYTDAYVQFLDDAVSAECLEDRLAAGLALADTARRLEAAGLSRQAMADVRREFRD